VTTLCERAVLGQVQIRSQYDGQDKHAPKKLLVLESFQVTLAVDAQKFVFQVVYGFREKSIRL
jgi:hypothetical protein